MPDVMSARVQKVIKPAHLVVVKEMRTIEVFQENGVLVETKTEKLSPRLEWRVVAIVDEDFVGEKEVTLIRQSEDEATKLVAGAIAYHF